VTLGASALGQVALGGSGVEAVVNYVDCAASITITSSIAASVMVIGRVDVSAQIAIASSVQCAVTVIPAVAGEVNIQASIAMVSALTASLIAAAGFPNAGVSFTMTDKAGGA
jgi:hypothetical protein